MAVAYTNNATTTLSATITGSTTSLSVASGAGSKFPSTASGDHFYITLSNTAGDLEIMKVTDRSTDTFTVIRGQDGTSGRSWSAGDKIELRLTKAMLDDLKGERALASHSHSGIGYTESSTAPSSPNAGDRWFNTATGVYYIYINDGDSSAWVEIASGGSSNWGEPGAIGATTPNSGAFTTLSATGVATFSAGTASAPAITTSGDTNNGIYFPAADNVAITTGGTQRVLVNSSGNVGIGTDSPFSTARLQVKTGTNKNLGVQTGTTDTSGIKLNAYNDAADTNVPIEINGSVVIAKTGETERMRIDSSGNVGIGTISPGAYLHTSGTVGNQAIFAQTSTGTNYIAFSSNGTNRGYLGHDNSSGVGLFGTGTAYGMCIGTPGSIPLGFFTNNTERMRIDSSGNVGIRTSSPVSPLTVYQASSGTPSLGSTTYYGPIFQNSFGGYGLGININSATGISLIQSQRFDGTATAYDIALNPLGGNVGIGTSSPSYKLHVYAGDIAISNQAQANVHFRSQTNTNGFLIGRSLYADNANNFYIYDATNSTTRLFIDPSGNIGIGAVATAYGVSASTPHKQSIWFDPASNYDGLFIACTATSGTAALFFTNTSGGSPNQAGYISVSGGTASYTSGSDYRMKENVKPMTGALEAVAKLKPVTFDWKDQFVGLRKQGQGFLAHELAEVVPDCVSGVKDEVDANGRPKYQAVDTSFLVATLTAAIQEQQQQIDALKAEMAELRAN